MSQGKGLLLCGAVIFEQWFVSKGLCSGLIVMLANEKGSLMGRSATYISSSLFHNSSFSSWINLISSTIETDSV